MTRHTTRTRQPSPEQPRLEQSRPVQPRPERGRRRAGAAASTQGSLSLSAPITIAQNLRRGLGALLAVAGVVAGIAGIRLGNATLHTAAGASCGTYFAPLQPAAASPLDAAVCTQAVAQQSASVMVLLALGLLLVVGGLTLSALSWRRQ